MHVFHTHPWYTVSPTQHLQELSSMQVLDSHPWNTQLTHAPLTHPRNFNPCPYSTVIHGTHSPTEPTSMHATLTHPRNPHLNTQNTSVRTSHLFSTNLTHSHIIHTHSNTSLILLHPMVHCLHTLIHTHVHPPSPTYKLL